MQNVLLHVVKHAWRLPRLDVHISAVLWNIVSALPCPLDQAPQALQHRSTAAATHRLPQAVAPPQSAAHRPRRQRRGLFKRLVQLPLMALGAGLKVIVEVVRFGYSCTTSIGSRVLPRSIMRTLQGELASILFIPLSSVRAQPTRISHVYLALQLAMHVCTLTTLHTAARLCCLACFCIRAHKTAHLGPCFQACSQD